MLAVAVVADKMYIVACRADYIDTKGGFVGGNNWIASSDMDQESVVGAVPAEGEEEIEVDYIGRRDNLVTDILRRGKSRMVDRTGEKGKPEDCTYPP